MAEMKLQFKHQQFQADACNAVCDVFAGQPISRPFKYTLDPGNNARVQDLLMLDAFANQQLYKQKNDLLDSVRNLQIHAGIKPSSELEGDGLNLTVEMETGTGKTYTYIKTMYELNKRYGWTKFIIVVPSVAIREGVNKSFQITADHFQQEYGKKVRYFIYNSARLGDVENFATSNTINCMIINVQAFAARGKDARRINMALDSFKGRKPIDVIAKTNPIIILDEPQSMEGVVAKDMLKQFQPLFVLRYSATHRTPYNMVYRLDALDAYNQKLVKKIEVRGVSVSGNSATSGYVYLSKINTFKDKNPTATIEIDYKTANGSPNKKMITVDVGHNLYEKSGHLDEYKNGWVITNIRADQDFIEFQNGTKIFTGDVVGDVNADQLRRIQIRETIRCHLDKEQELFNKGVKVLSLFFIDDVENYRPDDKSTGKYAQMFEQEYEILKSEKLQELDFWPEYKNFLDATNAQTSHQGYFAKDKKGNFKNSKETSVGDDDIRAYDLIMKNKERLLSRTEPVRFIFSHSALREGWDNPNVFQICTLKNSNNNISRRQEIGRGLRLCVNQNGERMDSTVLDDVHKINVLTVIASESYQDFVLALQKDMAEELKDRPREVTLNLFQNQIVHLANGEKHTLSAVEAQNILFGLMSNGYIDNRGHLTEKYQSDLASSTLILSPEYKQEDIVHVLGSIYKPMDIGNANKTKIAVKLNKVNLDKKEFQELWKNINKKTAYTVEFETDELVKNAINAIDHKLNVTKLVAVITRGTMQKIDSVDNLAKGTAFDDPKTKRENIENAEIQLKYDLIGKIVEGTGLTRKCVAKILMGISADKFAQFKQNPEDFIAKTVNLINEQKATAIIEHVTYNLLDEEYDTDVFTDPDLKGTSDNTVSTPNNHIYNYVIADSDTEKKMANALETNDEVVVYAKLPKGFYITTPVGHYNPDWAIAFKQGTVKHVYFIAETKGSMKTLDLRPIEKAKIDCARKHFALISNGNIKYDVVDNYANLIDLVSK